MATLVERTSRFVVLVPLSGRDALTVGDAVIVAVAGMLPPQIARSRLHVTSGPPGSVADGAPLG